MTLVQSLKDADIFENYLNPVMLVFIGYLSLNTLRRVPMCQGFSTFLAILPHFVTATLANSMIRVNINYSDVPGITCDAHDNSAVGQPLQGLVNPYAAGGQFGQYKRMQKARK